MRYIIDNCLILPENLRRIFVLPMLYALLSSTCKAKNQRDDLLGAPALDFRQFDPFVLP